MIRTATIALLAAGLALAACAPDHEPPESEAADTLPVSKQPGPPIGDRAPVDMVVTGIDGAQRAVSDLGGTKGTVLVFFRSADWCPYCQAQLKDLKKVEPDLAERGYALAAVSYDTPETLREFTDAQAINYPLYSDAGSKLIDAFAIRDPQYTEGLAVGVPYASIFVLDPEGRVQAKSVSSDYRVRPTNDEILKLLGETGAKQAAQTS